MHRQAKTGVGKLRPRALPKHSSRQLRFEPLEDRRLLAIIADTFADTFVQVSRIVSAETTTLTLDENGQFKVFYHPNDELGYVDPDTGNLLAIDYFPGTSNVLVLDGTASGNLSDLAGVTYSNGQVITPDGGVTVYHRDGSIMRSGSTWTYDAGASLQSGDDYFWSNGVALRTGTTFNHPNNITLLGGTTLSYANGTTFKNSSFALYYPGTQPLRDTSFNHFYGSGVSLETGNTLYYANGAVMADATGNVFNDNGTPSFKPFSRTQTIGVTEFVTHIGQQDGEVTVSIQDNSGGGFAAYVTQIKIDYQTVPPDPTDLKVTYIDPTTLLFQWSSGGGSTAGYRVVWNTGVSAPGDVSTGVDTTNNYYVVSGLAPGQKVSLRVAAKDSEGDLSYGAIATGTAGALQQTEQTGELIASALDLTFAQLYETFTAIDNYTILTVDSDGNSFVWYYANDELGYVNIDNGDLLQPLDAFQRFYVVPGTSLLAYDVTDLHVVGNLSLIAPGAAYQNGQLLRSGDTYYHRSGAILRDSTENWYYPSGEVMKDAATTFWKGNIAMRSGATFRYPNNAILKSGTTISYQEGATFFTPTFALYSNGTSLRSSAGNMLYETGQNLFSSNTFTYQSGVTMIDSTGNPYFTNGSSASFPFEYAEPIGFSTVHIGEDVDRIARYAIGVVGNTSIHVLGGTVDYSVAPPPKPLSLEAASASSDSITFNLSSGGGTTQDFVYSYDLGSTAPYTPDGGTVVVGNTFTITGLSPDQQIAVRLFAHNSEGEFSPGITATGTTAAATLDGDHNLDNSVDAADYVLWRKNPSQHGNEAGYTTCWQSHFGETLDEGAGAAASDHSQSPGGLQVASDDRVQLVAGRAAANLRLFASPFTSISIAPAVKTRPPVMSKAQATAHNEALLAWLSVIDADAPESLPWSTADNDPVENAPRETAFESFASIGGKLLASIRQQ